MIGSVDWIGISAFIGAMTAFVSTVIAAVASLLTHRKVSQTGDLATAAAGEAKQAAVDVRAAVADVQTAVDTVNGQTAGQQIDASTTRDIAAIPPPDRTAAEAAHIAAVPVEKGATP